MNELIENELVGEGKVSIIKLEIVDILQGAIVGILDYMKISDGPDNIGQATFVGNDFYRKLKPRGCYTPSRFKKKQLFQ